MTLYFNRLTNYEAVNSILKGNATSDLSNDQTMINDLILEASSLFEEKTDRKFVPYVATTRHGYDRTQRAYAVSDLLEFTSMADVDGGSIDTTGYELHPINRPPYSAVCLTAYLYTTVDITAFWGWHGAYGSAWSNTSTLSAGITNSATSFDVASGTNFRVYDVIRIDNELMEITAIATNTLTVNRGHNGSTASAHDSADTVQQYIQTPFVKKAVTQLSGWLYQTRQSSGQRVQFGDGTKIFETFPDVVQKAIAHFQRPIIEVV